MADKPERLARMRCVRLLIGLDGSSFSGLHSRASMAASACVAHSFLARRLHRSSRNACGSRCGDGEKLGAHARMEIRVLLLKAIFAGSCAAQARQSL